ncbi:hypothetical protein HNR30_008847 [Nonomuraea soli]|uniref:Cysteinyl-tRNA ligase anticodon binding domain-containing protein n=1 Tax=Nonomuraea soli TaxID=1032476 RepID=A0A7W0CUM2_9ACTN|nr:hypothetical protein [Nonomuraea soli]MBA2897449.1 hypothetical protein [Nonomuraea soli]
MTELAERRAKARTERDFAAADALRAEIEQAGWTVRDSDDGFVLGERPAYDERPAYEVWPSVEAIPVSSRTEDPPRESHLPPVARSSGTGRDTQGGSAHSTTGSRPDVGAGADIGDRPDQGGIPATAGAGGSGQGAPATAGAGASGQGTPATASAGSGAAAHAQGRPGTAGSEARPAEAGGATARPGAELGFEEEARPTTPDDDLLHAQRLWDASLASNRADDAGITLTRRRTAVADITVTVSLLADGYPQDVVACVEAVMEHTTARVLAFDLGNLDGAGDALHALQERHPDRITVWHVAERPHWRGGTASWGACRTKLLQLDESDVHVLMESSTILTGDALTPLVEAIKDGAVAAGWKGVEPSDDGTQWNEAGPGRVRALLGYLMAVRRSAALGAFPDQARYYRNADLELSLALPGELVVPDELLPVVQRTHRGYHEVEEGYREQESRRNYDRVLRLLRQAP